MKISIFFLIIFFLLNKIETQNKGVEISEQLHKKRTLIFAKNTTDKPKRIFFKVDPVGYRRSSSRPLIKLIDPHTKALLITLIPLKDTPSSYTYTLVVNDEFENLDLKTTNK